MVILGIDPGLAIVGWGVIEYRNAKFRTIAYGSINTPAGTRTEERLRLIFDGMNELVEKYHPDCVAVEELFFTNNITTGIRVAEARGVILLSAERACIPMFEYTPPQVKQAVVGYGKAEKKKGQQIGVILLAEYHANSIRLWRVILLRSDIRLTPSDIRRASF